MCYQMHHAPDDVSVHLNNFLLWEKLLHVANKGKGRPLKTFWIVNKYCQRKFRYRVDSKLAFSSFGFVLAWWCSINYNFFKQNVPLSFSPTLPFQELSLSRVAERE